MLRAYKVPLELILGIEFLLVLLGVGLILINYSRKVRFYNELEKNLERLDQKYLVQELLDEPNFYEGQIFHQALYEIDKAMIERIKEYKLHVDSFKEYVEMWIHEIKIPIASLVLISHNENNKKVLKSIRRLDNYIDQILYYVRSEYTEKDFSIVETRLDKVVAAVVMKNKDDLLENRMIPEVLVEPLKVSTDAKWLEFILNQIVNNSIKYKKSEEAKIKISTQGSKLIIYDNGIGISESDLSRVFEKSFTGENGRNTVKSTGMGLYIAKKLCDKLGHRLTISSVRGEYTQVEIEFGGNEFYRLRS
ncbi:hypothetical protein P261_01275 [Lachnospiraceae bacterium TWA4]|nr:hypothetical protein P261_01275 [Lachnospiraceae bacterium TWA4]